MAIGFLFPGQGSQEMDMGLELYDSIPQARERLDQACDVLGFDLKALITDGPVEKLNDTQYAQPAIYTCSAMYLERAREMGLTYDYVAGHSLGEYSALYAAGVFSFADGLKLVRERGIAMSKQNGRGTMAAVMGLEEAKLAEVMAPYGDVVIANLNTPQQLVISGATEGIDAVEHALEGREGVIVKRLTVSAAFHSPQMEDAAQIMTPLINAADMREPQCYVVSNVTGKPTRDIDEIRANLIAQITGQVRWYDSILTMASEGVDEFYEVGNGKILRGMNRRIDGAPKVTSI